MDPELQAILTPIDERIAAAPEEERPALQTERAQAEANFYRGQIHQRDVDGWRAAAIGKYPHAQGFAAMVTGATAEEIEASARTFHEQVQQAITASQAAPPPPETPPAPAPTPQQAAAQAWGQPTGSAGQPPMSGDAAALENIHKGLREAYPGNAQGGIPPQPGDARRLGERTSKILNDMGSETPLAKIALGPVFEQMAANASNKVPGSRQARVVPER